ncbi:hypothetical protein [Maribacter sp. 1_MG-2023]|uniref:hypothetical protein n=1 Tax=Maribacter sp. 1_MG-2023 TaxID=3062677 RepID=UPI0026E271B8|nr:hypothetical protein [Maribacter sp. 1_MG-2023]MDO6473495.1 hypothetical protein [Maribacter sp. 1_MG-2023]
MNNLQYARVGNVRRKDSYDQTLNVQSSTPVFTENFQAQEASLNNNHLNNNSCK